MLKPFHLGDILVDEQHVLVIPEIGINHNGDLSVAKEMVLAAKRAGARLIKHQTHVVESEMTHEAKKTIPGNSDRSIYDIMASCALSEEEEFELKRFTEEQGLFFLSTPFSKAAVDRLVKMDVKAFKIGSGEMNNHPLLEYIASFGKPIIMSTGMNDLASVKKAVDVLRRFDIEIALMHTTNLYPTTPEQVRLGAMEELMVAFPDLCVGLSDHTVNNFSAYAAIARGACVVERHFTDKMERNGPDIVCSMDEGSLRELVLAAKQIPLMRGGHKAALQEEQVTIDFAFASVCSIRPIKKGEAFTRDNIWVKRPGTGEIRAEDFKNVLGKKAAVDIAADELVAWNMISK